MTRRALFAPLDGAARPVLGTLARLVFAAVLLRYFWSSALTKLDGPFSPSLGAYAQIFPQQMQAAAYDPSQFGAFQWLVGMAGTYAEFILPALIVVGLATRPAAAAMIGFIVVQSLTDIIGHGADAATIGALFDRNPDGLILDQRLLWGFLLVALVFTGAGPLSADRALTRPAQRSVAA
ncbi:DoxX family protein [Aliiroseovarius sp. PTFE2010]|uniref:DoxX family protein n=1 Tax=Aliiroseovarius sp. PTFE2010 TaxID=3417190 RepID=UPI003CEB15EF